MCDIPPMHPIEFGRHWAQNQVKDPCCQRKARSQMTHSADREGPVDQVHAGEVGQRDGNGE